MECPDGLERKCFPLLAMHVADHKEALKATATKMTHCTGCEAKQGELQMFGGTKFEKKTTAHMRQLYETRRVGVLDDCDHPLPGKAAEMGRIETEYYGCRYLFPCSRSLFCFFSFSFTVHHTVRFTNILVHLRLLKNAFWDFRLFDVYTQCFPDSLHMADSGIFEHILIHVLDHTRSEIYSKFGDAEANDRWTEAMDRLEVNLLRTKLVSNEPIGDFIARVGHKVTARVDTSTPMFKASEFRRLMLVFLLSNCLSYCMSY